VTRRSLPEALSQLNARARQLGVTETLHGMQVEDPYRALEQRSELTDAWITAQTERTAQALDALRDPRREQRLSELLSIGSFGNLAVGGARIFALIREGSRQQAALYEVPSPLDRPLLDPLAHGERAAIDWIYPSPTGRFVALGTPRRASRAGTPRSPTATT
jgi:prolyl oligopeptidase